MRIEHALLKLSATDLSKHLGCRHLTELDRAVAEGRLTPPSWRDPGTALLQQRGLAHEQSYVKHLETQGKSVVSLRAFEGSNPAERTLEAMSDGSDVIVQAELQNGRWSGRADVLLKVEGRSDFGEWSYEVVDTKLAQDTKGGTILQLCLYSALLGEVQGKMPERMHVVKPEAEFEPETFRFADFQAYFRLIKQRLEKVIDADPTDSTYPMPVAQCDWCDWWKECNKKRHDDDHLCLIAGMQSAHVTELQRQGVATLESFAGQNAALAEKPKRGSPQTFTKLHGQARVQLRGRLENAPRYELLPIEEERGFLRLPEPSPGDVFFDIEGDPFVDGGGLEYLLGYSFGDGGQRLDYRGIWAFDRREEKRAFEEFIDFVMDRWERHSEMHIYHYAPYEPSAVKRLMGRHGTRETEVDWLLRGGRFVDLFAVTRQGLRASVERYSLKDLEQFFGFIRKEELQAASAARRRVECALELNSASEISDDDRESVKLYNRDDCLATEALREWLEERRQELEERGQSVPRPESGTGEASEAIDERETHVQKVFDRLVQGLSEDREEWDEEDKARWLLANQLNYFRREDKCVWWEVFRIRGLEHEELLGERNVISGLTFVKEVPDTKGNPVHRYRFPVQEESLDVGDQVEDTTGVSIGRVASIDHLAGHVDIKKAGKAIGVHPNALVVDDRIGTKALASSLLAFGESVAENGLNSPGPYRAARDLLLRRAPRIESAHGGPLRRSGETAVEAARRLIGELDASILPIQGPPGSGKTFTGARLILTLAVLGKRVGVTAVSHKVIRNLLEKALEAARDEGVPLNAVHKVTTLGVARLSGLTETKNNHDALDAMVPGNVVGGTAWLWARDDAVEKVDYLIVDEAGQMSLAHVFAAGRSAHNIVLLGDPQQLEQPQKGAHPEGSEVAALDHILDGHQTIPDDKGLFLDVTWRLHPMICAFTSELYYDNRLKPRDGLEQQAITGDLPFAGNGLFYAPVAHEGNQNRSMEEVETVARIVERLMANGVQWTDAEGTSRQILAEDILIVAPYNAQVAALTERLPGCRVGTVDKFQGQEAPVVIYSVTSSSAEDAPRGMSFLYNPNRLNVATSRARCICILVAASQVFEPECRTPEQMRWANGLCRFREMAEEVVV